MNTFFSLVVSSLILPAVLLVSIYSLICWLTGRLVIGRFFENHGVGETFALGHAILAIFLQLIALLSGFQWYILAAVFCVIFVLSLALAPVRPITWAIQDAVPETLLGKLFAAAAVLLLLLFGAAAFSQPGTDAAAYYLAQPKLIAATGTFKLLPAYESFGVLPALAEMPYAVMYLFGGDSIGLVAAKLSMWPVLICTLQLHWKCARVLGASAEAAWVFVGLLMTSTAVTLVAWDGKTDLIGLMYLMAAVLWMPGGVRPLSPSAWHSALFGFMAASAVMAKFSYALILPFVLGVPLLLVWWRNPKVLLNVILISGFSVLLVFILAWWSKNSILFGDPFAPLIFLKSSTPKFSLDQVWFNAEYTKWIVETYPLAVTFGKYPMQHGGISPLWLILLPTLWMRPWQSVGGGRALYFAIGGLLGLGAWVLLRPSVIAPRYFLPALILPCLILILGYQSWLDKKIEIAFAAMLATLVMLLMHLESTKLASKYASVPWLDAVNGDVSASPLYALSHHLDADTRANAKVLLLSYATAALPIRMMPTFMIGAAIGGNENVYEFAKKSNIDYIVYSPNTHKRVDIDSVPPQGIYVEKITILPDVYYLYKLNYQHGI